MQGIIDYPNPNPDPNPNQGIIDYLTGPSLDAKILRDNFVFKVSNAPRATHTVAWLGVGYAPLQRTVQRTKLCTKPCTCATRQVVPMLNPDGVAVGNYRCSMAGLDLNRMWKDPSKRLTPAIWHMKQMMRTLQEDREIITLNP